jgi:hypothetical protein
VSDENIIQSLRASKHYYRDEAHKAREQRNEATERAEKAEAKLRRIEQVAIHTAQGNCIIPSSLILGGDS